MSHFGPDLGNKADRTYGLAAFVALTLALIAAYLGLSDTHLSQINHELLHFALFFLLALSFYWLFDTTRRRALNLTLLFVTAILGLGTEILRSFFTGGRFKLIDVIANMIGSVFAAGLCTIYHKRMLDRKRRARYGLLPQEGVEDSLELGSQENAVSANDEGADSTDGEGRITPGSEGDEGGGKT